MIKVLSVVLLATVTTVSVRSTAYATNDVHDIQAEISTGSGNLVLCKAEIEGEFNHKNVKSEQQAAVIDAYASLASDDEDNDMGADPGLEPVGK